MYYLIGSNNGMTRYRVLKIDRSDPHELTIVDDGVEYNLADITKLIEKIEKAYRRQSHRQASGAKILSAFGLVGKK